MNTILKVIWVHWFSDFFLQTDNMARGKSTSLKWLSLHILTYTIPLFVFSFKFAIINGLSHFVIDYFTSKITSKLWKQQRVHDFFCCDRF